MKFRVVIFKEKEIIYNKAHTFPSKTVADGVAGTLMKSMGGDSFRLIPLAN